MVQRNVKCDYSDVLISEDKIITVLIGEMMLALHFNEECNIIFNYKGIFFPYWTGVISKTWWHFIQPFSLLWRIIFESSWDVTVTGWHLHKILRRESIIAFNRKFIVAKSRDREREFWLNGNRSRREEIIVAKWIRHARWFIFHSS